MVVNNGGSNATSVTITDADSTSSPYSIGTMTAGQNVLRSYLLINNRTASVSTQTLSTASASGTDLLSSNAISASSNVVTVSIPGRSGLASLVLGFDRRWAADRGRGL